MPSDVQFLCVTSPVLRYVLVALVSAVLPTSATIAKEPNLPANGALWTPQSESNAHERPLAFARDVAAVLTKAGCNSGACHGSFQGRGGMRLSLLGFDATADYEALFKDNRGRRVFPASPEQSLVLLKATGAIPHGGGRRLDAKSQAYQILHAYIAQGLVAPAAEDPAVIGLVVSPSGIVFSGENRTPRQLTVRARWSDGVERDITPWALFDAREKQVAEVSETGLVQPAAPGRTAVTVRFMGQVAAVPVTIPYANIASFPEVATTNYIDELVAKQWREVGVLPAPLSSDSEFCRRVYVDLIGTLPTVSEVQTFLDSSDPAKRARLIDSLLERSEYVDYWSVKWGDLLRVHRRYVGQKGLQTFYGWVRRFVRENRPLDEVAREILTAQGNMFTSGPVAFYFVDEKPEDLAETTAQVFLGVRMQCTRCHHHPMEVWSQEDYYGLAAFFTRLEVKDNKDNGMYGGAKLIRAVNTVPKSRRLAMDAPPSVFGTDVRPESITQVNAQNNGDLRTILANAITSHDNPFFARNFANRYWAYLTGRGLVEPIDDLRATNPPSNPELLDALAEDLREHNYDVKHLLRTICNSRTYQLASEVAPKRDADGMFYTHRVPQRLPAEVLLDGINRVTGAAESFEGLPAGTRAIALPDPAVKSYFLDTFGRPLRNTPCECARSGMPDLSQALHLANSDELNTKIAAPAGRLGKLLASKASDREIVSNLYLAVFARTPTEEEMRTIQELLAASPSRSEGLEDLLWTLLNSSEFVFNH